MPRSSIEMQKTARRIIDLINDLDPVDRDTLKEDFTHYRDDSRKYIGHAKDDVEQALQRDKVTILSLLIELF